MEAGRRLAEYNHGKREELKAQKSEVSQYFSVGAIIAVRIIGNPGYYFY